MSLLNPSGRPPKVTPVQGFEAWQVQENWPWMIDNAAAIASSWKFAKAEKPALFDGRVLVARRMEIVDGVWRAPHILIPYSALTHWLGIGSADLGAFNTFASAVVVTSDGAVLLGRMAAHTANAGYVYFPSGTPDANDLRGTNLDIEGSMLRELREETGLGPEHVSPSDQRWISQDGPLVCCARRFDTHLTAQQLEAVVWAHLDADPQPELDAVVFVRQLSDLGGMRVLAYVEALLRIVLA